MSIKFDEEAKQAILKTLTIDDCNKRIDNILDDMDENIDNKDWSISESIEVVRHYRACYELVKEHESTITKPAKLNRGHFI